MALTAVAIAAALVWWDRLPSPPRLRSARRLPLSDLDAVARLLLVAVSSGLPLATAVELVVPDLSGPMGSAVGEVAREARLHGTARALLAAPSLLHPLAPMLARAHVSGASIVSALETFLEQRRRGSVGEATARARRTGVVLVVPLALLLLPGFGLVVFGPSVSEHLRGLVLTP